MQWVDEWGASRATLSASETRFFVRRVRDVSGGEALLVLDDERTGRTERGVWVWNPERAAIEGSVARGMVPAGLELVVAGESGAAFVGDRIVVGVGEARIFARGGRPWTRPSVALPPRSSGEFGRWTMVVDSDRDEDSEYVGRSVVATYEDGRITGQIDAVSSLELSGFRSDEAWARAAAERYVHWGRIRTHFFRDEERRRVVVAFSVGGECSPRYAHYMIREEGDGIAIWQEFVRGADLVDWDGVYPPSVQNIPRPTLFAAAPAGAAVVPID